MKIINKLFNSHELPRENFYTSRPPAFNLSVWKIFAELWQFVTFWLLLWCFISNFITIHLKMTEVWSKRHDFYFNLIKTLKSYLSWCAETCMTLSAKFTLHIRLLSEMVHSAVWSTIYSIINNTVWSRFFFSCSYLMEPARGQLLQKTKYFSNRFKV